MNIEDVIKKFSAITTPQTTTEKHTLAKQKVEEFKAIRELSQVYKIMEGLILSQIKKYGLHNYYSGKESEKHFFEEILDIPASTANQERDIWNFYYIKHRVPIELLMQADTYKLGRSLAYLREKPTTKVLDIVKLAKRGKMPRIEFLKEIDSI